MTRFIQQSACRGMRPAGVAPERLLPRSRLVSRLMGDRGVPRIIEAPGAFGKATLAFEYASMAFDFNHVFWMSASSPCFLRDLDAGVIASGVLECDAGAALVVMTDLPVLSEERARRAKEQIDDLIRAGCEVVITVTPSRNNLSRRWEKALIVRAEEMLLGAEEDLSDTQMRPGPHYPFSLERRIPGVRWGKQGIWELLEALSVDDLPKECEALLWSLLVLGRGSYEDARALLGSECAPGAWSLLAEGYPCVGIALEEGSFEAIEAPVLALRKAIGSRFKIMAVSTVPADRDELVKYLGGALIARGECRRAVEVVSTLAAREVRGHWLSEWGWKALWGRAAVEVCDLYEEITRSRVEERDRLNAQLAWAWDQQGDRPRTLLFAQRVLSSSSALPIERAAAALAAWEQGNAATREAMEEELAAWLARRTAAASEETTFWDSSVALLAEIVLCRSMGRDPLAVWAAEAPGTLGDDAEERELAEMHLLTAAAVLEQLEADGLFDGRRREAEGLSRPELVRLAALSHRILKSLVSRGLALGFGALRAASVLDRIAAALERAGMPALDDEIVAAMGAAFTDEGRARAAGRERSCVVGRWSPSVRAAGAWDAVSAVAPSAAGALLSREGSLPLLRLKLFGSLQIAIGDRELTRVFLDHPKARLLLALLALHRGRELTRERLASMLWPATSPRTGAKNFYRVWRDLSNVLSGDGPCPYLLRDRCGCRLDTALFSSDVEDFERLNRQLLFGPPGDSLAWEQTLLTIQESFGAPLLPAETKNEVVAVFRDRFAAELVDGLLAASTRLLAQGEPQGALWFSREALRRDGTREDAYAALMRAQLATDQRAAAVDTFFSCRDFLSDQLGLDPSPALTALYEALLEGDAVVG